ncbi:MAG TPA: dephospho-CoA kinase, partial [Nitrospina sp.]|nr:dephospho-CoA kinase [Nitrospina sp.]
MSILIGLTGGIGSGKSLAASYFREQGAKIIDADIISRQVVESGQPAWKEIVDEFGADFLNPDQSLNREKLATEVFQNEKKRTALESIVHPRIFSEEKKRYEEYSKSDSRAIVIIDAALLIESGNYKNVDKVVIVKTS